MTAYTYRGALVSQDVSDARLALADGLSALRRSMRLLRSATNAAANEMRSLDIRGDGAARNGDGTVADGGARRIRNRPPSNDAPGRVGPGNSAKVGGRVGTPNRPTMPAQPGVGQSPAEPSADPSETAVLPVVPGVTEQRRGSGSSDPGTPTQYPSRPDPSDPATEVWTLVERAQGGDSEAFGLIYDRYVDTVFRFVYFRVGNRQLAEDLTSDTFLRALKRIGSFT